MWCNLTAFELSKFGMHTMHIGQSVISWLAYVKEWKLVLLATTICYSGSIIVYLLTYDALAKAYCRNLRLKASKIAKEEREVIKGEQTLVTCHKGIRI